VRLQLRSQSIKNKKLIINAPVVYMARVVMILMRASGNIHYKGQWMGWALKIETFVGPEMATSKESPFVVPEIEFGEKNFHSRPRRIRIIFVTYVLL
jgi:hypothetical protein